MPTEPQGSSATNHYYHQLELPLFPHEVGHLFETTNIHLFGIARMCSMTEMEVTAYIYDNYSSEYIAERHNRAQDYHYRRLQSLCPTTTN